MYEFLKFKELDEFNGLDAFNIVFEVFGIDFFIIISMNKIISKLCIDEYLNKSTYLEGFFEFSKNLREKLEKKKFIFEII